MNFEKAYKELNKLTYYIIKQLVISEETAKDLNQITWIKIYFNSEQLRDIKNLKAWVCTIAKNSTFAYFKQNKSYFKMLDRLQATIKSDTKLINSDFLLVEKIEEEIMNLPEKQRLGVMLRTNTGASYKDIAQRMGCGYDTAKANTRHGFMKIRKKFEDARG